MALLRSEGQMRDDGSGGREVGQREGLTNHACQMFGAIAVAWASAVPFFVFAGFPEFAYLFGW